MSQGYRGICPHCQLAIEGPVRYRNHVERCPLNPTVAPVLLAFLHANAENGVIMTSRNYYAIAYQHGLPCWKLLDKVLGGWADVATWAGLKLRDSHYGPMAPRQSAPVHVTCEELAASLPGGLTVCRTRETARQVYYLLR